MPSDLEHDLRRVFAGDQTLPLDVSRRDALEAELLQRLAQRPSTRRRRWPRLALGIGLGAALAVGACALPADYDADLGHRLAIVVTDDVQVDPQAIAGFVTEHYAPDELRMAVSQERVRQRDDDGSVHERAELRIEIDAVGEDLDTDRMWDDLVEEFPQLEGGRLEDEELRTVIHGTIGGRLSHAWLDVVIDERGVDAAKAEILLQLDAQGVHGDAHVEVVDDEDAAGNRRREVRVWVQDESP
jgi:hypothetical protein